jgi:hypothetical protein
VLCEEEKMEKGKVCIMKKIFMIMAVLMLVSPAWAVVTITATPGAGADCNEVTVGYSVTGPNNVRGFALDVTVDAGTIGGIVSGSYKIGESTSAEPGYGIFPGTIVIAGGAPTSWGEPLADPCDDPDGTLDGPGSMGMTVELASLYKEDVNEPDSSGTLFKFWVTADCTVSIDENTTRGGIVMEDPDEASGFNPAGSTCVVTCVACTNPGQATNPNPLDTAIDVDVDADLSWTAGTGAASHDVYFGTTNPPAFQTQQTGTTYDPGTMANSTTYYWQIGEVNDCGTTAGVVWSFTTAAPAECLIGGNAGPAEYTDWVAWGKPDCWCYQRQCRGDATGTKNMMKWVQALDLNIFRAAFLQSDAALAGVTNGICADFNHKKNMMKRVQALDLTIFRTYFLQPDAAVPLCDQAPIITGPYNFWTN